MSFGWSAGDIVAAIQLVVKLAQSLEDSTGSSSQYREVIRELYALEKALVDAKNLQLEAEQHHKQVALFGAALQCRETIDEFMQKIGKYQPALRQGGSGSWVKDALRKMQWSLCIQKDVDVFRASLNAHTSAIGIMLQAIQIESNMMQSRAIAGQRQSLVKISEGISVTKCILDMHSKSLERVQLAAESHENTMEKLISQIGKQSLQMFEMICDMQTRFAEQLKRQQPVYFFDALGHEWPLHLDCVKSAEHLMALLRVEFKDVGLRKIEKGQFLIEDSRTNRKIDLSWPWKVCFKPGQRVNMSMIFENLRSGERRETTCPRCHEVNDCGTDHERACLNCGTRFQRIEDVSQSVTSSPTYFLKKEDNQRKTPEVIGPAEEESDEESDVEMGAFSSVTLVSKKNDVEWIGFDSTGEITIEQGVSLQFRGPDDTYRGDYRGWALRAGHPLSQNETGDSICYYEITVLEGGLRNVVCIGLCSRTVRLDKLPGWEPRSWGYHGDDGRVFSEHAFSNLFGPTFGANDVVGCGLISKTRAFFTKNGTLAGVIDLQSGARLGRLYPVVGMKERGVKIQANFGRSMFMYDLDQHRMMKNRIETEQRGRWRTFQRGTSDFEDD